MYGIVAMYPDNGSMVIVSIAKAEMATQVQMQPKTAVPVIVAIYTNGSVLDYPSRCGQMSGDYTGAGANNRTMAAASRNHTRAAGANYTGAGANHARAGAHNIGTAASDG